MVLDGFYLIVFTSFNVSVVLHQSKFLICKPVLLVIILKNMEVVLKGI